MGVVSAAGKPPLGKNFCRRRMRRGKRSLTHYRVREKSAWWWQTASGRHVVENNPLNKIDSTCEETTCTENGSSGSTCTTTTTITPTGSHIPQTTTSTTTTANGHSTTVTSGAGAMPGGRIATSTDGASAMRITATLTGTKAQNSTGGDTNKVSKHNFSGQSGGMDQKHRGGGNDVIPIPANLRPEQKKKLYSTMGQVNAIIKAKNKKGWTSEEQAAKFLHTHLDPISIELDVEIGASIYKNPFVPDGNGAYVISTVRTNEYKNIVHVPGAREGFIKAADWHTHGRGALFDQFDDEDLKGQFDHFLSNPSGRLRYFNYKRFNEGKYTRTFQGKQSSITIMCEGVLNCN